MKLSFFFFLAVVGSVAALTKSHPRGCKFVTGRCVYECEKGTHLYFTDCEPYTPEATCEVPEPQADTHPICDYLDCYCDAPTVRDTSTGKCVPLESCPKKK